MIVINSVKSTYLLITESSDFVVDIRVPFFPSVARHACILLAHMRCGWQDLVNWHLSF